MGLEGGGNEELLQKSFSNTRWISSGALGYNVASIVNNAVLYIQKSFPGGSEAESVCNAGDIVSIPGLGRSPGEGNSNPLQHTCLGNPMDRRTWRATVHEVMKELDMT